MSGSIYFSYLLCPRREKTIWSELESNSDSLASQAGGNCLINISRKRSLSISRHVQLNQNLVYDLFRWCPHSTPRCTPTTRFRSRRSSPKSWSSTPRLPSGPNRLISCYGRLHTSGDRVAVVSQQYSACLVIRRSWLRIPLFFFYLFLLSFTSGVF